MNKWMNDDIVIELLNRIGWFPFSYTHVAELESLKTLSERFVARFPIYFNCLKRRLFKCYDWSMHANCQYCQ